MATGNHRGVNLSGGTSVSSTASGASAGTITITGTGGTGSSNNYGVNLTGTTTDVTSVAGAISITGTGGIGSSNNNWGVSLLDIETVSSTGTGASAATITIAGTGGAGTHSNVGVLLFGTTTDVTSVDGAISITGTGGNGSDYGNHGVELQYIETVSSTGTGASAATITIAGTGGTGMNIAFGVLLFGATTDVTSVDGAISITGTGGSADFNYGVHLRTDAVVQVTTGLLTVTGTANTGNSFGVLLSDSDGGQFKSVGSGGIVVTANGNGTADDFVAGADSILGGPTAAGAITINADSIAFSGTLSVQSSGALTIQPRTASTTIGLGGGSGTLDLDDTELGFLTNGFSSITIGHSTSGTGAVDVDSSTLTDPLTIVGGSIAVTELNAGSNAVTLTARTGAITDGGDVGTDVTGGVVTLNAGGAIGASGDQISLAATTLVTNSTLNSSNGNQFVNETDSVSIGANDLNAGSGAITLNGGTFLTTATGSILSPVTVASGATLGGTGTTGTITTESGGNVAPGNSPGILNSGNVTLVSGSNFNVEIDGTAGAGAVGGHDQLNVTGTVNLGGANLVITLGYTPVNGNSFVIVNNNDTDPVMGTLKVGGNTIADGGTFTVSGTTFVIDYTSGSDSNDVTLTVQNSALAATIVGNDLVIEDVDGTGKNNVLSVSRSGGNIVITDANEQFSTAITGAVLSNGNKTFTISATDLTTAMGGSGKIIVKGQGGSDSLSVDVSTDLGFDVDFLGGSGTSDSLTLAADTVTSVTHAFTNANDGSVTIVDGGSRVITYTGLEPITDNLSATNRVFTFNGGAETITLIDATGANMTIDSDLSESVTFANPSGSLTINAGTGNDTVTITSVDADGPFNVDLTINGDADSDMVNLNGDITFASGESLIVNAESVTTAASADFTTSGAGVITLTADDVAINAMSTLVSASIVTIQPQTTNRTIDLGTNTAGSLSLTDGELDRITAGTLRVGSSSAGAISISAVVGPGAVTGALSLLTGSTVSQSGSGAVSHPRLAVTAGGAVTLSTNANVVDFLSVDTSTGNINFLETSGLTVTTLDGVSGIDTDNGTVTLLLQGGNFSLSTNIDATTGVSITLQGDDAILSTSGGTDIESTSGSITLIADEMTLSGTVTGTGQTVTLRPNESGELINLGTNSVTADTLELTDAELDLVTASRIIVGNSNAGAVTFSAAISMANSNELEVNSGSTINDTGSATVFTTPSLALNAASGVGTSSTLNVAVSNLEAAGGTGGVNVTNSGNLTIGGASSSLTGLSATNAAISVTAASDITVTEAISSGGGSVSLTATSGVTLSGVNGDVTTGGGSFTVNSDSDTNGSGSFTSDDAGSAVSASGGAISITAADVALTGTLAGTSTLSLIPSVVSSTIGIGGGAGTFNLDDTDLTKLTDGFSSITVGNTVSGTGAVDVGSSTFTDPVTIAGGSVTVNGALNVGGNITLKAVNNTGTLTNEVTIVASVTKTASGTSTIRIDAGDNIVHSGGTISGSAGNVIIVFNADTEMDSSGGITQTSGHVAGNQLSLSAYGDVVFTNATNNVDSLAATVVNGSLDFQCTNAGLGIGTVSGVIGITTNNKPIIVTEAGLSAAITVGQPISSGGGNITLSSGNGVTLSGTSGDVTTGGGSFTVNADSNTNGSGSFTSDNAGSAVSASGGAISITAADVALTGTLAGTSTLTLIPSVASSTIGIGGGTGTFNVDDTDLTKLTDGFSTITIGNASAGTGAVDVDSSTFTDPLTIVGGSIAVTELNTGSNAVTLTARSTNITDGGDVGADVTASSLTLSASTGIGSGNALETIVSTVSFTNTTNGVELTNTLASGFTASGTNAGTGTVSLTETSGNLTVGAADIVTNSGAVNLTASGTNKSVNSASGSNVVTNNSGAGAAVTWAADNIDLGGNITAGTGVVTLKESTTGTTIDLGSTGGPTNGTLELTAA